MDTIRFIIEDYIDEEYGFRFPTINIYINENNLIHLVERIERGYRLPLKMGQSYPQSYVGLHTGYYRGFRDEFLGHTGRPYSILLTCTCLEELCNSIIAKIDMDSTTVTWSEIRSPFLGEESGLWKKMQDSDDADGYPIDYSALSAFVFDRKQYMDALNALERGR